jgi:hypothetical protein
MRYIIQLNIYIVYMLQYNYQKNDIQPYCRCTTKVNNAAFTYKNVHCTIL